MKEFTPNDIPTSDEAGFDFNNNGGHIEVIKSYTAVFPDGSRLTYHHQYASIKEENLSKFVDEENGKMKIGRTKRFKEKRYRLYPRGTRFQWIDIPYREEEE